MEEISDPNLSSTQRRVSVEGIKKNWYTGEGNGLQPWRNESQVRIKQKPINPTSNIGLINYHAAILIG